MRIKDKISVSGQVALFGFSFLYLISVVLHSYAENKFDQFYSIETNSSIAASFPDNQNLVLKKAASISTFNLGFIAEKESFVLPTIFFLGLLLLLLKPYFLYYSSFAFRCRFLYLIRVLPNAP